MGKVIRLDANERRADVPRRVKRRPNSATQSAERRGPKPDADLERLGIRSFQREYKKLVKLVDGEEDFSSSRAAYALLRAQLAMLIQALPVVEQNLHQYKNERAAYALTSISGHTREIVADLRAFGDQSDLVERVRADVVQEVLRILATGIVSEVISTRQAIHSRLPGRSGAWTDRQLRSLQEKIASAVSSAEVASVPMIERALGVR